MQSESLILPPKDEELYVDVTFTKHEAYNLVELLCKLIDYSVDTPWLQLYSKQMKDLVKALRVPGKGA